jgi:hypothetical protein
VKAESSYEKTIHRGQGQEVYLLFLSLSHKHINTANLSSFVFIRNLVLIKLLALRYFYSNKPQHHLTYILYCFFSVYPPPPRTFQPFHCSLRCRPEETSSHQNLAPNNSSNLSIDGLKTCAIRPGSTVDAAHLLLPYSNAVNFSFPPAAS